MAKPHTLGASLYVPANHKNLYQVAAGELRSVIFCTEDAVAEADLEIALANLASLLPLLDCHAGRQRFVRVRNPAVLHALLVMPGVERLTGFVLPKTTAANFPTYFNLLRASRHLIMPTLETLEVFDDQQMVLLRNCLLVPGVSERIMALRIGGNDLLALLGIRRPRNLTLYSTPLGLVISRLVCCFRPYGFGLTAPVFEYLDNPSLLAQELTADLAHGLVGKTAIHPNQLALIDQQYRVNFRDMEVAQRLIDQSCPAVFKMHNAMCELSTHRAWAHSLVERAQAFGIEQSEG